MSESEFATNVVDLLERAFKDDFDTMRDSYYVWAWRRAREIHELKLQFDLESRPLIQVRIGEVNK